MQLSEKGLCLANKLHQDNVSKASGYFPMRTEQDIFELLGLVTVTRSKALGAASCHCRC